MTETEKNNLRTEISKRINSIEEQIIELKELTKPIEPDCAIGRVSRMDAINNQSINTNALQKKLIQREGLVAALDNMNQSSFGVCIRCGKNIPMGRILLMPESRRCVACS